MKTPAPRSKYGSKPPSTAQAAAATPASRYARILEVVARIPHGRLATYGQIATLAGLPRQARLVGYALHHAGDTQQLPWHRVVNAQGGVSFPVDSEAFHEQRKRLEAEGIALIAGRADLSRCRWVPHSDAPLLD